MNRYDREQEQKVIFHLNEYLIRELGCYSVLGSKLTIRGLAYILRRKFIGYKTKDIRRMSINLYFEFAAKMPLDEELIGRLANDTYHRHTDIVTSKIKKSKTLSGKISKAKKLILSFEWDKSCSQKEYQYELYIAARDLVRCVENSIKECEYIYE